MCELAQSVSLWIGLTLLSAAAIHVGVLLAIPYAIGMRVRSMGEQNTMIHAAKPTADFNPVRRASPDLIYSLYGYDLSEGPLHVTAPVSGTYMSVSCYAMNTDNFYVKNDQQVDGSFDFVLVGPRTPRPEAPGSDIARSPTTTGGIIFRYFVGDGSHDEQIESIRHRVQVVRLDRRE